MDTKRTSIGSLLGEVLESVDDCGNDNIVLRTVSGRTITIYHEQDCCEVVRIVGRDGEWRDLIGKVIVEASKTELPPPAGHRCESGTATEIVLRVDDATVISRWIGESNGYYSESVDVCEWIKEA